MLEVLAHEVRPPLVPVEVLEEAEEDGVDRHRVDGEEAGGDCIGTNHYEEKRGELVVQLRSKDIRRILKREVCTDGHDANHDDLSDEKDEVSDPVKSSCSNCVLDK